MKEELLKGLTEKQIEKASKCKSADELLALARDESVKLTPEQLAAISGGCGEVAARIGTCPQCHHASTKGEYVETTPGDGRYHFVCPHCGYDWTEK